MSTLLPEDGAEAASASRIGDTMPARKMLEAEGLRYENHVDIFDAGPVLECHIADLRTVRESVLVPVRDRRAASAPRSGAQSWYRIRRSTIFASARRSGVPQDGMFLLTAEEAAALRVKAGDPVRVLASQPR